MNFDKKYTPNNTGRLIGHIVKVVKEEDGIVNVALTTDNPYTKNYDMHFAKATGKEAETLLSAAKNDVVDMTLKAVSHFIDKRDVIEMHVVTCDLIG